MTIIYLDLLAANLEGDLKRALHKESLLKEAEESYRNTFNEKSPYEKARGFVLTNSNFSGIVNGTDILLNLLEKAISIDVVDGFTSVEVEEIGYSTDELKVEEIKDILAEEIEQTVFISVLECLDGDIEAYLSKMGVLEGGNIRENLNVKLVTDIANPYNQEEFTLALNKVEELSRRSSKRIEWLAGPVALEMIKKIRILL
ncbi:MAG: hypothetical protein GY817_04865 [bacterium]|nr:hypothetical protein [bacterium]